MPNVLSLAALLGLATVMPGWAQNPDSGPVPGQGEITIPSEMTLEQDAVTSPRNEFSRDDTTATRQMEQQNRRIDEKLMKGICSDC